MIQILRTFLVVVVSSIAAGHHALSAAATVTISVRAELEGDVLHIRGSATVPDGAWIIYAAYRVTEPSTP
jgi:hypothetical protein